MPGTSVALLAPAKINLALHVTGRRPDGYHALDSLAVFAGFGDRIEISRRDGIAVALSGPFATHAPGDQGDLAWRAADAFFRHVGRAPAASIRVEKNIPAGAGLGGGSADAAAVLAGLNQLDGEPLSHRELSILGLSLGADVPMCLTGRTLRARGIGEEVSEVAGWPSLPLLLVWPGVAVSTPACFQALARRDNPPLPPPPSTPRLFDIAAWLNVCRNDLEAPAVSLAPVIGEVLAAVRSTPGCRVSRMTGSGSACYGLYATAEQAGKAAAAIGSAQPGWMVTGTHTL